MITGKFIKIARTILKIHQIELANMAGIQNKQKVIVLEAKEGLCDERPSMVAGIQKIFNDRRVYQIIKDDKLITRYLPNFDNLVLMDIDANIKLNKPIIFGEFIRAARAASNINQKDFATQMGISNKTLVALEALSGIVKGKDKVAQTMLDFFAKENVFQAYRNGELIITCDLKLDAQELLAIDIEQKMFKNQEQFIPFTEHYEYKNSLTQRS
jgi:transcriptional regulator with XRE-family HTH domain